MSDTLRNKYFEGVVEDICVFNKRLTDSEICYYERSIKEQSAKNSIITMFNHKKKIVRLKSKFRFKKFFCAHEYSDVTLSYWVKSKKSNWEHRIDNYKKCEICSKIIKTGE